MNRTSLFGMMLSTFVVMGALWSIQPLMPLFGAEFGVPTTRVANLTTWSLIPMCVSPLIIGLVMQVVAPRRLIAISTLLLGVSQLAFSAAPTFFGLEIIRFVQGILIATALPAYMTYIANTAEKMKLVMALYVAAAIMGGLMGRVGAGLYTVRFSWRQFYVVFGVVLILTGVYCFLLQPERVKPRSQIRLKRLIEVLQNRKYLKLFTVALCAFFAFGAIMNYLPFRLTDLDPTLDAGVISLSYSGFILGLMFTLAATWIARKVGGELRAVILGASLIILATLGIWYPTVAATFAAVALVAPGYFLVHTTLAGYLNVNAGDRSASINALYVTFYYVGGTLGAFVPGLLSDAFGWSAFVIIVAAVALASVALTWSALRGETEAGWIEPSGA